MAIANTGLGANLFASIGRRGERPDLIPARLASKPQAELDRNGRAYMGAVVITAQKNLAGETYLSERLHNLAFAFDRSDRVEILDGTAENPKSISELIHDKQAAQLAFAMSRPQGGIVNLSEEAAPVETVVMADAPAKDKAAK